MEKRTGGRSAPTTVNSLVRTREYLTGREVERLMAAARKGSRRAHRDATMILVAYRHGLRASEVCDLQWQQIELSKGRLHVHRVKNGICYRIVLRSSTVLSNTRLIVQIQRLPMNASGYRQ